MFKYCLILFFSIHLHAGIYPDYQGLMNDNEGLLPPASEWYLNKKIIKKQKQTNHALMLLTVSNYADQSNLRDYLMRLYKHWKIKPTVFENSVILFVSKSKNEVRLFVGKKISDIFPKKKRQQILDHTIRPAIKKGKYKKGIKKGMIEILPFL
ncbi:hypothetical protein DNU06_05075 [Putridiphycobacter roseus]|uniref:TPM domain-containing protein n=1 Tax=Putridiphycobacter roseus TaxID=2219161 RepID=A0A2W1NFX4_9FLAO|nr:TPM domain-containing protein [Putridiphycobacter roseus]PZE17993.1 hypothetical protein DNU06_05075 [Putridiphycobacter roseus]